MLLAAKPSSATMQWLQMTAQSANIKREHVYHFTNSVFNLNIENSTLASSDDRFLLEYVEAMIR